MLCIKSQETQIIICKQKTRLVRLSRKKVDMSHLYPNVCLLFFFPPIYVSYLNYNLGNL